MSKRLEPPVRQTPVRIPAPPPARGIAGTHDLILTSGKFLPLPGVIGRASIMHLCSFLTSQPRADLKKGRFYSFFFHGTKAFVTWGTHGREVVFKQMKTKQNLIFILSKVAAENESTQSSCQERRAEDMFPCSQIAFYTLFPQAVHCQNPSRTII